MAKPIDNSKRIISLGNNWVLANDKSGTEIFEKYFGGFRNLLPGCDVKLYHKHIVAEDVTAWFSYWVKINQCCQCKEKPTSEDIRRACFFASQKGHKLVGFRDLQRMLVLAK